MVHKQKLNFKYHTIPDQIKKIIIIKKKKNPLEDILQFYTVRIYFKWGYLKSWLPVREVKMSNIIIVSSCQPTSCAIKLCLHKSSLCKSCYRPVTVQYCVCTNGWSWCHWPLCFSTRLCWSQHGQYKRNCCSRDYSYNCINLQVHIYLPIICAKRIGK